MEDLISAFESTFEDRIFSRSERQALKQLIAEASLDERKRGALRAKLFDFAREQFNSHDSQQVVDWLENANKLLLSRQEAPSSTRAYFSPGDDILDALLTQIQSATRTLAICVFTITDDRITNRIIEAHKQAVDVRIITDNDKADDRGSDIYRMAEQGLPVRIDNTSHHMHNKFALIDGRTLLTGSYNWTRSAANVNHENLLITEEANVVRSFKKEFEELWQEMTVLSR